MNACIEQDAVAWGRYTVWSSNSLYREYPKMVDRMKDLGCDVVNMDTLSLYAVAPVCAHETKRPVGCIYVGTVTDSKAQETGDWDSDLMENVKGSISQSHNELVHFLVETVLPLLSMS